MFIVGLVLIIISGDKFVDSAVSIAKTLGVNEVIIGATIVSLGTTLPEILVSTTAGIEGSADIAAGNAFGSIICNTAFIAGMTQLFRPTKNIDRKMLGWRSLFFFAAAVMCLLFGLVMGFFDWRAGILLVGLFLVYVILNILTAKSGSPVEGIEGMDTADSSEKRSIIKPIISLFLCAALLFVGARLLVDKGILLAEAIGVPERVIGVTFIALGTSLPELVTAITSIIKGHANVSIGNILGANILNLLLVIGIPSILCGIWPSAASISLDLPIAICAMAILIIPMVVYQRGSRAQGALLTAGYLAYCIVQF